MFKYKCMFSDNKYEIYRTDVLWAIYEIGLVFRRERDMITVIFDFFTDLIALFLYIMIFVSLSHI
jgi:hypothetical protein